MNREEVLQKIRTGAKPSLEEFSTYFSLVNPNGNSKSSYSSAVPKTLNKLLATVSHADKLVNSFLLLLTAEERKLMIRIYHYNPVIHQNLREVGELWLSETVCASIGNVSTINQAKLYLLFIDDFLKCSMETIPEKFSSLNIIFSIFLFNNLPRVADLVSRKISISSEEKIAKCASQFIYTSNFQLTNNLFGASLQLFEEEITRILENNNEDLVYFSDVIDFALSCDYGIETLGRDSRRNILGL